MAISQKCVVLSLCFLALPVVSGYEVTITPNPQKQLISDWGYDIKQGGKSKSLTPSKARELFIDDGMTLLRVSIWGDKPRPAHPADGVVVASYYKDDLYAMTNARNVLPNVKFFASKKLAGMDSFPAWVKDSSGIIPEKYARLVADYLEFFEERGFVFDVLGLDNEDSYNEGQMTAQPWRYKETVDLLRVLAQERGFHLPLLIGPEDYGPKPKWMQEMVQKEWGDRVDIVGTHYYPRWRPMSKLRDMLQYAGDRPIWHSEVHWDNMENEDVITEGALALATVFDCFDVGFTGMAWWAYTRSGIKGDIEKTLTRTTVGHRPITVQDFDGGAAHTDTVITRAFRAGSHITLWILNEGSTNYSQVDFALALGEFAGIVNFVRWTPTQTLRHWVGPNSKGGFTLPIPAHTLTCIEIEWEAPVPLGHYKFDGDFVDAGSGKRDGLPVASPGFVTGKSEQAVAFSRAQQQVEIPYWGGADFSLCFWIHTATSGGEGEHWEEGAVVLSSDLARIYRQVGISLMQGRIAFGTRSPVRETTILSETSVNDEQWHHIAATRNASTGELVLYIDGKLEDTGIGPDYRLDWATSLWLGSHGGAGARDMGFLGSIDDLRFYDRMLAPSEVDVLVNGSPPPRGPRGR